MCSDCRLSQHRRSRLVTSSPTDEFIPGQCWPSTTHCITHLHIRRRSRAHVRVFSNLLSPSLPPAPSLPLPPHVCLSVCLRNNPYPLTTLSCLLSCPISVIQDTEKKGEGVCKMSLLFICCSLHRVKSIANSRRRKRS